MRSTKKTYKYSIKKSTFKIKKATLKGKNYLVCFNILPCGSGKKYKQCCGK
ncbi:MAG: hypothetical protein E7158_01540 [Firmicutes bacterium]|nr:hypothetical protein [Bacillota bacterium]